MKKYSLLAILALSLVSVGCRDQAYRSSIVNETYVHKYGVPISKDDWVRNGRNGKIVRNLRDGVTLSENFDEGVLSGETTLTFPNSSTLHVVKLYKDGVLLSQTENYPTGEPMRREKFTTEALCDVTHWYEDGTPMAVESYEGGFLMAGEYRSPLNEIESRVTAGMGTRVMRDSSGEISSRDTFQHGEMVERTTFFPNGEPASITHYENGEIHGERLTFYHGGSPKTVEAWAHNLQDGITTVYRNGEKFAEVPYVAGQKQGVERRFRDGAEVVEELTWRDGIQHGPRKIVAGATEKTEWFHNGQLVTRNTFERMNVR